jgi:IclR family transcriptional regulator, acetate operon repressor
MTVPAARRTLDLIELFARERQPMSVSQVAKELRLPVSSCHGLIKTLEKRGYLMQVKSQGGYYFTRLLEEKARAIGGYDPVPETLLPALKKIRDKSGETALLAKLVGTSAVYVEVLESSQSIRYAAQVGDAFPLNATAVGKAIVGSMPAQQRDAFIDKIRLTKRTMATIVSRAALKLDLEVSEKRGWYMTLGEYSPENAAVAVPVKVGLEHHYAVAIAGPVFRIRGNVEKHARLLKSIVRRLNGT